MALPEISTAIDFKITTTPTKTYRIDFDNKRIAGTTDGLDAMVQAVKKMFTTSRYSERIYTGDYGSEWESLIGKSAGYIRAKARQIIEDTISSDSRIKGVKHVEVTQIATDKMIIEAYITTQYGEINLEHELRG